ncbi:MAG: CBS domain-containing protein, partial [Candidatus Eiseniibacteriota bacterium]
SVVVRQAFGYSFSTWRFHLRGVRLRGAYDIGWVRDMTVGRLMRRDPTLVTADTTVGALRQAYPAGSTKRLFVVDGNGAYVGVIDSAALYTGKAGDEGQTAGALAQREGTLLQGQSVRAALERFEDHEVEALAVLDAPDTRRVIGYLTEAYAQRRYRHALERQRSHELDDSDVFGPPAAR